MLVRTNTYYCPFGQNTKNMTTETSNKGKFEVISIGCDGEMVVDTEMTEAVAAWLREDIFVGVDKNGVTSYSLFENEANECMIAPKRMTRHEFFILNGEDTNIQVSDCFGIALYDGKLYAN